MKKALIMLAAMAFILFFISACGIEDVVTKVRRGSIRTDNTDDLICHSPMDSFEFVGMDCLQTETILRQAGFEEIKTIPLDDIDSGIEIADGAVESVRINGINEFYANTDFSKNDDVIITYHRRETDIIPIERIIFVPEEIEVAVESPFSLEYTVFPENANYTDVETRITDGFLEESENLVFYAKEEGDTEISFFQDDRFLGKCIVHAKFYEIEELVFEETVSEVFVGEEIDLGFKLFPKNATAKGISVVSTEPGVADAFFDERGIQEIRVEAISPGEAAIIITTPNGTEFAYSITVKEVPPAIITVTNTNPNRRIEVGTPIQLAVSWNPDNTTTKELTWSSSDRSVISVDSEGNLEAVGIGTAEISAAHKTGVTGSITLTVEPTLVTKIEISTDLNDANKFFIGDKFSISASVVPENATDKTLIYSSKDEAVAKVSNKGVVTAVGVGSTEIVVSSPDGITKTVPVKVSQAPQKFKITWSTSLASNDHVGNSWSYEFKINGESFRSGSTIVLDPKSSLTIEYRVEEADTYPDIGTYYEKISYSDELCKNGYSISTKVSVKENRGRYSGNYAKWSLTVSITPVN